MGVCIYEKAWIGTCGKPTKGDEKCCEEHKQLICSSCGKMATRNCDETMGPFVCGAELCDECEHWINEKGTNAHLKHVKKGEQQHLPWYARGGGTIS